ncbi:stage II sporulation protein M [[Eubacterium] cellulosolvens]
MRFLNESLKTAKKMKKLLILITAIYIITYFIGYIVIRIQVPGMLLFIEPLLEGISTNPVYTPIITAFDNRNLAFAILYTFIVNLSGGAFATTTLPGIIPLIGAAISGSVTAFRGFMIGALFTYAASIETDAPAGIGWMILALGTLFLELGAYVFSATAGINLSLSSIFPNRYFSESRKIAFREAWKDAGRLYIIVVILLILGAIWEMTGIYLLMP